MKCEPIFEAYDDSPLQRRSRRRGSAAPHTVFLAPHGEPFDDAIACELAREERLLFVCGHYEGIDERAYALADRTLSLGDYVLTSGELASMVVIDAVVRKLPGVLGAAEGRRQTRASPTGCSNTRSTRVPPASAAWTCPPCSSRATTAPWAGGAGRPRSRRRRACAPTFWKRPGFRPLIGNF